MDSVVIADISEAKSVKNLSPNIIDSLAFLSPNSILSDFTVVVGESTLTLLIELRFIVSNELNNIESFLELNSNLPDDRIICSPTNLSGVVGGEK